MEYQCTKTQIVALMVDGYEDEDKTQRNSTNPHLVYDPEVFFQTAWRCDYSTAPKETSIKVKLPHRFLYRPSLVMPKASQLEDVSLKVKRHLVLGYQNRIMQRVCISIMLSLHHDICTEVLKPEFSSYAS